MDEATWQTLKRRFYVFDLTYEVWCCDICFIAYLLHKPDAKPSDKITEQDILHVTGEYCKKNKMFPSPKFGPEETKKYEEDLLEFYKTNYLDKSYQEAILSLYKYSSTWDTYSLSIIFGRIVENFDIPQDFEESKQPQSKMLYSYDYLPASEEEDDQGSSASSKKPCYIGGGDIGVDAADDEELFIGSGSIPVSTLKDFQQLLRTNISANPGARNIHE
jgi:hypothetical protein